MSLEQDITLYIFLSFIIGLFLILIIAEMISVYWKDRPSFLYNIYVEKVLRPELNGLHSPQEILDLLTRENQIAPFIWRQSVFMAMTTATFSTLFLYSLGLVCVNTTSFVVLFIILFFFSMLLFSLQSFHYYYEKASFEQETYQKLSSLLEEVKN